MPPEPPIVAWIMQRLEDPDFYRDLLKELPRKAANFYSYPPSLIKERLHAKLLKGTKEHGDHHRTAEQIRKELEDEYLDLIGWSLVLQYHEQCTCQDH